MGFDEGQIFLDTEQGSYLPGQTVYGRLVFDQAKPKDIYGIYISFKGFCKVHWTTTKKVGKSSRTVHHTSYEEYFNRKIFVFGSESEEHQLEIDHYEFSFNFELPADIPSSFEGGYGHIRYRVKAVMVTSGVFSMNKEKRVIIRLVTPVNLNLSPPCREPQEVFIKNAYCRCGFSVGSSEVRVKLPVGGYCPGQTIRAEVTISNLSSVDIEEIEFIIRRKIKFRAVVNPGVRFDRTTVANYQKGPAAAGTVPQWTLDLPIPPADVYNFDNCQYISISHKFKVIVTTSGCHKNGKQALPILLGNIPLVGYQDNIPNLIPNNMPGENVPGGNYYPAPPLIMPPGANTSNPNLNYPQNAPYPTPGNPPYPYPPNEPYPQPSNVPYPHPSNEPYPNSGNQPYPNKEKQPYSDNGKKPEEYLPQPGFAPGYPSGSALPPPYPGVNANVSDPDNAENLGFVVTGDGPDSPLLAPGTNPTDPHSNTTPSAPKL